MTGARVREERSAAARALGSVVAAIALPIVLAGIVLALFFNPLWVSFEQGRSQVDAITGYTPAEVTSVTNGILHDLIIGPPSFDEIVNGQPVLNPRERQHMVDVRGVLGRFGLVVLVALVSLLAAAWRGRRATWFWSAIARSAAVLAAAVVVVGLAFAVSFDAMFELFHELFFPAGSFDFDPRTNRLVQLFPDQFWSETTIVIAGVGLMLAVGIAAGGRAMANRLRVSNAPVAHLQAVAP